MTQALLTKSIAERLEYTVPLIKLCLVHEGEPKGKMFPLLAPEDAEQFLEPLRYAPEEHFVSLHLNARNEILGLHEVSHGTLASSLVHPREVFKAALLANSFAILVCHNHPSCARLEPSKEDLSATANLLEAGKILGVGVVDHLILSPNQTVYSIRENYPELWASPQTKS